MSLYSLVHLTSAETEPSELIRLASKSGFDCVSLRAIPTRTRAATDSVKESITGKNPFSLADNKKALLETKQALAETGIIIHDVENARIFEGVDVRDYEKDLETAAELGVHEVLTNIWTDDPNFYEEKFIELCEIAYKFDININLEIVTWSCIPGIAEAARLLKKVEQPNQGIVLDTFHFYRSGNKVSDLNGLPSEWFRYIHMCDAPSEVPQGAELVRTGLEERLIPGEGVVDIKGILNTLPPVVRGLEIPHKNRIKAEGIEKYLTQALHATKQYLRS